IDITTSFYNLHHVFQRELGDDMGFLAWRDAGLNPYGNSIIVNAKFLEANRPLIDRFVKVTQRAFRACVDKPEPCVQALVDANGALKFDNELQNWKLVEVLMSDKFSREVALGIHEDKRMQDDYELVRDYIGIDKPFDVKSVYTNEFLDRSIRMPK
ncbi:MAG: nitrate ABC transporter substrate-binding protein, partial [Burkholderiales bacterium]